MPRDLIKKSTYDKEYYKKNRAKKLEASAKWRRNNFKKIKTYQAKYKRSPKGRKSSRITDWKRMGIICNDFSKFYDEIYMMIDRCNFCYSKFTQKNKKTLDHDHNIKYKENIRGIICNRCNVRDELKIIKL